MRIALAVVVIAAVLLLPFRAVPIVPLVVVIVLGVLGYMRLPGRGLFDVLSPRTTAAYALAGVLFLVVVEIGAWIKVDPAFEHSIMTGHPTRIFTLEPGLNAPNAFEVPGEPPIGVSVSRQGLRDQYYGPKPTGERRILVLGDSFVMGWKVALEDTFVKQTERILNDRAPVDAAVINGGVGGYGAWQARDLFEEIGVGLEPDAVVLALFVENDLENELLRVDKVVRRYNRAWRALLMRFVHRNHWRMQAEDILEQRWNTYRYVKRHFIPRPAPIFDFLNRIRFLEPYAIPELPKREPGAPGMELNLAEYYPEIEEGLALMAESIAAVNARCKTLGIPMAGVVLPGPLLVDPALYAEAVDMTPAEMAPFDDAKAVAMLEKLFHDQAIPTAHVLTPLRTAERDNPGSVFLPNDGHYAPKGHAIVADALAPLCERAFLAR